MSQYERHVPHELMDRLHHATEHFHACREQLEAAMRGSEFRHQERVDAATQAIRQAEHEVEQIEAEIQSVLSKPN